METINPKHKKMYNAKVFFCLMKANFRISTENKTAIIARYILKL